MAIISEKLVELGIIKKNENCHICGKNEATGFWQGHKGIFCVCEQCAKNVLPILIVDSLAGHTKRLAGMEGILTHIKGVFWKAAYIRRVFADTDDEWCSYSLPFKDRE